MPRFGIVAAAAPAMPSASSSSSAVRRRGPFIPTIPCPDCGRLVVRSVSGMPQHDGWTYYKCQKHGHGCNFWHWELEYVVYLVDHAFIQGDGAIDAIGWVEDRREELQLRKAEKEATGDGGARAKEQKLIEQKIMNNLSAVVDAIKKVQLLLMMIVVILCLLCALLFLKNTKSSYNYYAS